MLHVLIGEDRILLLRKEKFGLWKLKSAYLPCSEIFKWPYTLKDRSIWNKEADPKLYVLSWISSSWRMWSLKSWSLVLLDKTSSMYL